MTPTMVDVLILNLSPRLRDEYFQLVGELAYAGLVVEVFPSVSHLGIQFKHADRTGVAMLVMMDESNWTDGVVRIKDLRMPTRQCASDNETTVGRDVAVDEVVRILRHVN